MARRVVEIPGRCVPPIATKNCSNRKSSPNGHLRPPSHLPQPPLRRLTPTSETSKKPVSRLGIMTPLLYPGVLRRQGWDRRVEPQLLTSHRRRRWILILGPKGVYSVGQGNPGTMVFGRAGTWVGVLWGPGVRRRGQRTFSRRALLGVLSV